MGKYIKPKGKDGCREDSRVIKRLREENEQLKELVEEAFHEGWGARSYSYEDGMSSDDWATSETKIKLEVIGA